MVFTIGQKIRCLRKSGCKVVGGGDKRVKGLKKRVQDVRRRASFPASTKEEFSLFFFPTLYYLLHPIVLPSCQKLRRLFVNTSWSWLVVVVSHLACSMDSFFFP